MNVDPAEVARLQDWVASELVDALALPHEEAAEVARACCSSGRGNERGTAATVVALARAVASWPAAGQWWAHHGHEARQLLRRGGAGDVEDRLGEALAPPAADTLDMNWPDHKVFWAVDIPEGCSVGDEFLAGDGMGGRAWMRVTAQAGRVGVTRQRPVANPLDELFHTACDDADRVMGR